MTDVFALTTHPNKAVWWCYGCTSAASLFSSSGLFCVGTITAIFRFHLQLGLGLSLKQTLGQGQSQQGRIHESPDIVVIQLQAYDLSRGKSAGQPRLHALSRVDASHQRVLMEAINFNV